jgi:hypothetical protein
MAVSITKRTLAGFRKDIRMNVKCYSKKLEVNDLVNAGVLKRDADGMTKQGNTFYFNGESKINSDMITVLRAKPEAFCKDIVQGVDFWHVYNSIPKNEKENINNMKFKAIVGNPPYQINDGGEAASDAAMPIYHKFISTGITLQPRCLSMITPSKWMVGGRGLKEFRKNMINDHHIKVLVDFENSFECFPRVHIDGGVSYFLWDNNYSGKTQYTLTKSDKSSNTTLRYLKSEDSDIVIRDLGYISIIEKTKSDTSFSEIVSARKPFNIGTDLFNAPENYGEYDLTFLPDPNKSLVYGVKGVKGGAKRIEGYISIENVTKNKDWIDQYKILVPKAWSADAVIPPQFISADKNSLCTETFLVVGPFNNKQERDNCFSYMHTNFFRALLFWGRGTMQVSREVFRFVPIQDFSRSWTDEELYKIYDLDEKEIKFIDNLVKPME